MDQDPIPKTVNSDLSYPIGYGDKQLLSILIDSPVAFYICDVEGRITFFNEVAAKLWGQTPKLNHDLWCGSWKLYYPDGTRMPLEICPMAMCLQIGKSFDGTEVIIERPDGSFRNVLVYPKPLLDENKLIVGAHNTLVDVTAQRNEEKSQARLASIITSSDDAIISKDLLGRITSWNHAATRMFGYEPEEVIGKSIKLLIPRDRLMEEDMILNRISKGEQVSHYETERLTKAGEIIKISLTISPIKNQDGLVIGASKIARNITELVVARKKLKKYTKELELLNEHKDDFMSLASHELKTPLTSAKAYVQLLAKVIKDDDKGFELIERAIGSISRLEKLINDLLDVSKINNKQLSYHMETFGFDEVIKSSIENVKYLSNTHTIRIKNTNNAFINGDKFRLEQVLNNLLTNAMKYSPDADRVEVESKVEGDALIVSVKDFGIGIPKESIDHLVERYYRVNDQSPVFSGLGIGLYLSMEILKYHQGKLLIESEENKGSTFHFLLPVLAK